MEITIKRYSRKLTYEDAATLDEFWELAKRTERSLDREQRRHWDGRECDEYIIAAQGVLPYCATPEELVCQQETLDEILAVLALCTPTQRERFLLYALYDYSYAEIGRLCGCAAVPRPQFMTALRAFGKSFSNFTADCPDDHPSMMATR